MSGKFKCMWVFVAIDAAGNEGIMATGIEGMGMMPLVTASENMVEPMKKIALEISASSKMPMRMLKFEKRVEIPIVS